ncbi:MAG TPA: hypothetical protein VD887_07255 [Allosphingosinicella sp.]|nr:hypothetical protein [Allosphingosinicella sp.]
MAERKRGKKRRQFKAARREVYLEDLRRTGNYASAARAAGITDGGARRYRQRHPEFEAECVQAKRESQRRLAGAESPLDGTNEAAFESIRRGADGRLKIQAQGRRRWSKRKEELFFDVLRECGNVAASARAAEVSKEAVWKRRREWPGFARRMEETLDEAEVVLEFRVACLGTNWSEDADDRDGAETAGAEEAAAAAAVPFDPDLAIRFLKWRRDGKNGRHKRTAALPPAEEVRARIVRKVTALKKHRLREERRRREQGE